MLSCHLINVQRDSDKSDLSQTETFWQKGQLQGTIQSLGFCNISLTIFTRDRSSRHINANSLISDSSHQEDPAPDVSAGELSIKMMVIAILDDCYPPDISSGSSPGGVAKHLKRKTGSRRQNVTTEELDPDRDISR